MQQIAIVQTAFQSNASSVQRNQRSGGKSRSGTHRMFHSFSGSGDPVEFRSNRSSTASVRSEAPACCSNTV